MPTDNQTVNSEGLTQNKKLFLIDAYAIIYRSYYALIRAPRINSKGMNTSAVMGFCNTLNEVLEKQKPTHIAVAFDHGKTFRHEAFPPYKAQREETPEDIKKSIPYIKDILRAYNIPILQVDGFEADDIIGTVAGMGENDGMEVYMLTPDKDYAQLVTDHIHMYKPRHGGGYDDMGPKEVCEKYGIANTSQVIDLLGLMGDSADNFPGCPGVGEKTAVKLILEYGSIEGLLNNTSSIKGKMREKVEAAVEDIKMAKYLATIRKDVPMTVALSDMSVQKPNEDELSKIFAELEFKSFADRILKKPVQKQKTVNLQLDLFAEFTNEGQETSENAPEKSFDSNDVKYVLVDKEEDMRNLCGRLATSKEFAFDTETTSTNTIDAELVGLSFAIEEKEAFYIPVPPTRPVAQSLFDVQEKNSGLSAQEILEIFRPAYESAHILKVVQNGKYDIEVLKKYNIEVKGELWDTMVAHYLIDPETHHNMDYMAETLLGYRTIHIEELIGPKGKMQKNMRDIAPEMVKDYAAEDADITLRLKHKLEPMLEEKGAAKLFHNVEMPLIPVLVEMEMNGVTLDTKALGEVNEQLLSRASILKREIYEIAGQEFNIDSPRQVGDILFGKMQIVEKPKKTKTGQYVTSEEVLNSLRASNPIVGKILDYRGLKKLLGTYVDALPKLINTRTGHVHTSFNQCVTATGRLSSSDPNLQNIPVRSEDGKEIRRCMVPEKGCLWYSCDYSQVELRIMASLSGDKNMIEAFNSGQDIHAATAAKIYHLSPTLSQGEGEAAHDKANISLEEAIGQVTKDERRKAKSANFGITYGISAFGLSQGLGIDRKEAKQLIDGYFESFPQVQDFIEQCKATAREKGYAETLMGRRRYLRDINSHNGTVRAFAERNAVNAPIQGTAADIMKVAMINVFQRIKHEGLKSKMLLQVHDELNFSVPVEEKDQLERIVTEEMQNACHLAVPLRADGGWGKNWLEAH